MPVTEPEVRIASIGTALSPWSSGPVRVTGADEDAVTLAVTAGLAALGAATGDATVERVVFVTPDPPLFEGGNGPVLLAGLGLSSGVEVVERLGAAPATLDALASALPATLVIGADPEHGAGAAAALVNRGPGATLGVRARVNRSLPIRARGRDGVEHDDGDPRLEREREREHRFALAGVDADDPLVVGVDPKDARALGGRSDLTMPTKGASARDLRSRDPGREQWWAASSVSTRHG